MTHNKKETLKVEYVPIKSVKPSSTNTRAHPPEQIDQIARSIEHFGWTKPGVKKRDHSLKKRHDVLLIEIRGGLVRGVFFQEGGARDNERQECGE